MEAPDETIEALVAQLRECGKWLSPDLRAKILAAGERAAALLVDLLCEQGHGVDEVEGEDWSGLHAADLLADMDVPWVIPQMVERMEAAHPEGYFEGAMSHALRKKGAAVVEPALARYAVATRGRARGHLRGVLVYSGVRDDRVFAALLEGLVEDAFITASWLAQYGDPRALEALYAAVAREPLPGPRELSFGEVFVELAEAIEALDGDPPIALARKLAKGLAISEGWRAPRNREGLGLAPATAESLVAGAVRRTRMARIAPCPCGSEKLYKHCCIGAV